VRFILTAAVWVVILSLVTFLFSVRGTTASVETAAQDQHKYSVSFEITPTFSVKEDPFALDIGDGSGVFSIILNGETVLSRSEGISDRVTFSAGSFTLERGKHEIFIRANPAASEKSNAVRLKILVSGNPVSDKTYWFPPGQAINASHIFTLEGEEDHAH